MPLYKKPQPSRFTPQTPVEMHFHDHDETWVVMGGCARASAVGRDGKAQEFTLEQGDIWMIEAGVQHGCDPARRRGLDLSLRRDDSRGLARARALRP